MSSNIVANEDRRPSGVIRLRQALYFFNNIMLIPMFTLILAEAGTNLWSDQKILFQMTNVGFCTFFLLEWIVGLLAERDRRAYLMSPANIIDLVSSIPFGYLFQGLRFFRILRVFRILRLMFRARRYQGRGDKLFRMGTLIGATVFAGAIAIRIAEPETAPQFSDAIWWSIVTLSTVGYGDIVPSTPLGRAVAAMLMTFGIGVFGYIAGFMATILEDPDEQELLITTDRMEAKLDAICRHLSLDPEEIATRRSQDSRTQE